MAKVEQSVSLCVPVSTAYNQWTQFEEFPKFMDGVEEVRQLDDAHLHWRTKIGKIEREFDTEILEQVPDERIVWRSTEGPEHSGVVTFTRVGDIETEVTLAMTVEPHGLLERMGFAFGMVEGRIRNDLDSFRDLIERRGHETGAWRGEIHDGQAEGRFTRENQGPVPSFSPGENA